MPKTIATIHGGKIRAPLSSTIQDFGIGIDGEERKLNREGRRHQARLALRKAKLVRASPLGFLFDNMPQNTKCQAFGLMVDTANARHNKARFSR